MKKTKSWIKENKSNLYVLFGYTILTCIMSYPVILFKVTYVPGEADVYSHLWYFWWFKEALIELGTNPFFTDYMFYPKGVSLIFSIAPGNAIFLVPLQLVFGLIKSYKILFLFTFIASGYGTYLLVKYLTGDTKAAFISGLIFMFCPYHFAHALGHTNLMSIEWIPFYVLFLIKIVKENKRSDAIYAAFFLFLTAICCYYYLIYLFVFTLMFLLYYLWADKRSILKKDIIKRFSIMIITFGLFFSPFAYPLLKEILITNYSYLYIGGFVTYSADFLGFFIPSLFHPVFKGLVTPIYQNFTGNIAEYTTFIGYTVIFLSIISVLKVKTKETQFWSLSAMISFILCLGPILHIKGVLNIPCEGYMVSIPLPYLFLMRIPIISIARVPSRWDVLVMLSLAVLAGYGLSYVFKRFDGKFFNKISKKHVLAVIFSCLILFEFLAIPYPMSSAKVPEFYEQIANEHGDYAIFNVPNRPYSTYLYYQTVHEKKIVNGYVSRPTQDIIQFSTSAPLINQLTMMEPCGIRMLNQNITEIGASALNYYNIRYIILHKNYLTEKEFDFANNLLQKTLKGKPEIYEKDGLIVYKVKEEQIKSFMMLGERWHGLEKWHDGLTRWMENNGTIVIHHVRGEEVEFGFRVASFYKPRTLQVYLNDRLVTNYEISTQFTNISIKLHLDEGENIVRFYTPDGCQRPVDIPELNNKDPRCLSLAFQNIFICNIEYLREIGAGGKYR